MDDTTNRPRDFIFQAIPIRDDPVEYARKARRRATPNKPRSSPACWSCRTRKVRCIQGAAGDPCLRCKHFEQVCVPQTRPRRPHPLKHMYRDFVSRMEFTPPSSSANTPESTTESGEIPSDTPCQTPSESVSMGTQTESDFAREKGLSDGCGSPPSCDERLTERKRPTPPKSRQISEPRSKTSTLEDSLGQACMMLSRVEAMTRSLQGVVAQLVENHRLTVEKPSQDEQNTPEWILLEEEGWDYQGVSSVLDAWDEIGELNIA